MSNDIVVASTTDSQRDVDLAAGIPPEEAGKPPKEEKPEGGEAAAVEGEETPAEGGEAPTEEEEESAEAESADEAPKAADKPKGKKDGRLERINKLTRRTYELRDENDRLAEENRKLREKLEGGAPRTEQAPVVEPEVIGELPPEPDENQFLEEGKTYKDFLNALWDWREKKKAIDEHRKQAEEARRAEEDKLKSNLQNYTERVAEAREKYPDWEETLKQPIQIPRSVQTAIIEMDNGPDVAYFLGKHPEICEGLLELSSVKAVMEIGRISDQLAGGNEPAGAADKTVTPPPVRNVTSNAPPPISPVKGVATKSSVPVDELPYREYRRVRDEQERSRYK